MPTKNQALIYEKIPTGFPVPGEHLSVKDVGFDLDQDVPANSLVLETLYVSFDPYMRGMMRDPAIKSYAPALTPGSPVQALSLLKVLRSSLEGYAQGDMVVHSVPVQEYNVFTRAEAQSAVPRKVDAANGPDDIRHFIGALGMPGLTAYSSLYEIGKPKKGETILVSSAAGAVGQLVGVLAKREGLTVLGSVGSDEKLRFIVDELGFDGGWNYKTERGSTREIVERLTGGKGIDIFYDNVGGEQLEGALDSLNTFGRVVACGQISQYNLPADQRHPIRNSFLTVVKRLSWIGFLVSDPAMGPRYAADHQANVTRWLKDGSFKAKIHETVGIENGPEAFVGMLRGDNFGKAVLKVKL